MKKSFILMLAICLSLFSFPSKTSAVTVDKQPEEVHTQVIPKEVQDADIERQINLKLEELNNNVENGIGPMSRAIYTSETIATKYRTISGYAGGQPPNGYQFPTGGGFWWVNSGGPSASSSITFEVPYKLVNVSVTFGIASNSNIGGLYVSVPNKTDYFKLYISKTMQVRQVNFYRQATPSSPKVLYDIAYYQTLDRQSQWARAQ